MKSRGGRDQVREETRDSGPRGKQVKQLAFHPESVGKP